MMAHCDIKKDIDLTLGLPIWYGAKISEIEECMDSIYSALEKFASNYNKSVIKIIIGIDNIPENFEQNGDKKNNIYEIKERIKILCDAIDNLNKDKGTNFSVEYFITEFNVRVSIMRNIMISKSQNSKYICFSDHDDKLFEDFFIITTENIKDYYKNDTKAIYYKSFSASSKNIKDSTYQGLAPWGILVSTELLLENNIAFIPGIPLEDRFFRREMEHYLIEEEQINSDKIIYHHNREQGSGFINENMSEIVRQELAKKSFYSKIKLRNFSSMKRGLDEIIYFDIFQGKQILSNLNSVAENVSIIFNKNQHILENELDSFKFFDKKGLFNFIKQNHFALCSIISNENKYETFCRGFITNGSLENFVGEKTENKNFQEFKKLVNILVELLNLKAIQLIPLLKYLYLNKDINSNEILEKFVDKTNDFSGIITNLNTEEKHKLKEKAIEILLKLEKLRNNDFINAIEKENLKKLRNILKIDKFLNFEKISYNGKNIIDFLNSQNDSSEIKQELENYLFNQAFNCVIKENLEELEKIINLYPKLLEMKDKRGITLSNIACRNQTIGEFFKKYDIKKHLIDDRNKVIAFLLSKSLKSFEIKDKYGKDASEFLIELFSDNLKFNFIQNKKGIKPFLNIVEKILAIFAAEDNKSYELIPFLRYLYKINIDENDNIISNLLLKSKNNNISEEDRKNFSDEIKGGYLKYIALGLIKDNLLECIKNKNYDKINDILFIRKESNNKKFGAQKGQEFPEITFLKYTIFPAFLESINKSFNIKKEIIKSIKNDVNIKEIVNNFLLFSIQFDFDANGVLYRFNRNDPICNINLEKYKYIIKILFNKKFNFDKKISFNELVELFLNFSNTIKSLKLLIQYSDNISKKTDNLDHKNKNKINKIHQDHKKISKDIENGKKLLNRIESLIEEKGVGKDLDKINKLLEIFKDFVLNDLEVLENKTEKADINVY